MKNALVVFQVAGSFLLLMGAGLFIRSLVNAQELDVGFAVEDVAMIQTVPRFAGYSPTRVQALYDDLLSRVRALPGVESAAIAAVPPVNGPGFGGSSLIIEGYESATGTSAVEVPWTAVSPGYFETLQIPILNGRAFSDGDNADSPAVVVINETMARRYFGTVEAAGRRFRPQASEPHEGAWIEIVGVVADLKISDVTLDPGAFFYRPWQSGAGRGTVIARTRGDVRSLVGIMERELGRTRRSRLDDDPRVDVADRDRTRHRDSVVARRGTLAGESPVQCVTPRPGNLRSGRPAHDDRDNRGGLLPWAQGGPCGSDGCAASRVTIPQAIHGG